MLSSDAFLLFLSSLRKIDLQWHVLSHPGELLMIKSLESILGTISFLFHLRHVPKIVGSRHHFSGRVFSSIFPHIFINKSQWDVHPPMTGWSTSMACDMGLCRLRQFERDMVVRYFFCVIVSDSFFYDIDHSINNGESWTRAFVYLQSL